MTIEIAGLKVIADLLVIMSDQISKLKGTPKKRLATLLTSLLVILKRAEENTHEILECLDAIDTSKNRKERLELFDKLQNFIMELRQISFDFVAWVEKQDKFSSKLDLIYPKWEKSLHELRLAEKVVLYNVRANKTKDFVYANFFDGEIPSKSERGKVRKRIQEINKLTNTMIRSVRKLAINNLTIEDLF